MGSLLAAFGTAPGVLRTKANVAVRIASEHLGETGLSHRVVAVLVRHHRGRIV